MKNILITGASGQVGNDLCDLFEKYTKKNIYLLSRTKQNKKRSKNIFFIKHDLKNPLYLKKKIDVIIHCAVTHEFSKKKTLIDYYNSNILSLINLTKFGIKNKVKYFINFSTISIYKKISNKYNEDNFITDNSLLAVTKLTAEKILEISHLKYVNLRLPGIITQDKNAYRPWIKKIINKIKSNRKIIIYGKNNLFNNLIRSSDIFLLIISLLKKKNLIMGTFNYSATKPKKLSFIIGSLIKKFNSKSKVKYINSKKEKKFIPTKKIEKIDNLYFVETKDLLNSYS